MVNTGIIWFYVQIANVLDDPADVTESVLVKEIRKFFLKHNKSFRLHLGDYEKHNFFPFEGL